MDFENTIKSKKVLKYQNTKLNELINSLSNENEDDIKLKFMLSCEKAKKVFVHIIDGSIIIPYEVIEMLTPNKIIIRQISVEYNNEIKDYIYFPNKENPLITVNRSHKNHMFKLEKNYLYTNIFPIYKND